MHDPRTDEDWIPVACPGRGQILVHEKLVVEEPTGGSPRDTRIAKTPDAVREAVLRWTCHVAMLADSRPTPWGDIVTILEELLTALSPMRATMRALADVDPSGRLAKTVMRLTEATWQLNEGEVGATREAIAAAANALARYLAAEG